MNASWSAYEACEHRAVRILREKLEMMKCVNKARRQSISVSSALLPTSHGPPRNPTDAAILGGRKETDNLEIICWYVACILISMQPHSSHTSVVVLPPKTRLNISLALCAVAIAGIFISDRLEEAMPPPKGTPNSLK